eukprot:CAMPEP_0174817748 /NCGR_PEP_ID=MMETSP1107-20130205/264_1 /TAXON_ID=36770 /ORGANISM="Paraphysomonas vestita, Strain GFlagA" /LENGTH=128 /DNA_ID=CAMNT_0016028735 /DNA_START=24 /DNA_END=410 /DNA_ORIENTATION=-
MNNNHLPFHSGPVDVLRYGFESLENDYTTPHPIINLEKNRERNEWNEKLSNARKMYGIHMAMRLATERETFDKPHRLYGLPSSKISLDSAMGTGLNIGFSDFLNDPHIRPEIPKIQLHEVMEAKLGLM